MKTPVSISQFFSQHQVMVYKKNEIILRPEDEISYVYFVQSGYIRMHVLLPDGKELTVNIFKPGSYFPMFLILGDSQNTYYFQASTESTCMRAPKQVVLSFLHEHPEALMDLTKRINKGMNGLLSNIPHLLFGPVRDRIRSIILAQRFGEQAGGTIRIALPLTHQDIANYIGITRETTSIELQKLVKQHIISYEHQHILIQDIDTLSRDSYLDVQMNDPSI